MRHPRVYQHARNDACRPQTAATTPQILPQSKRPPGRRLRHRRRLQRRGTRQTSLSKILSSNVSPGASMSASPMSFFIGEEPVMGVRVR